MAALRPVRAMLISGLPLILLMLFVVYVFAVLFPTIGVLLLITTPLAVIAALAVAGIRARRVHLVVSDELVQVTNGQTGVTCERRYIKTAILVERFARRPLSTRATNLIFLDAQGRTLLMLAGMLWPADVLERVVATVDPADVVRMPGRQTPKTLAARFPRILDRADGEGTRTSARTVVLYAAFAVVLLILLFIAYRAFFGG